MAESWSSSTHRAATESGSFRHARPAKAKRSSIKRKEYDFSKGQRGAVVTPAAKTRISIMLDDEVIKFFRARAASLNMGYQTTINAALRSVIMNEAGNDPGDRVITVAT